MTGSILQFTRSFEKLKSDLSGIESSSIKLALLIDFWPKINQLINDDTFEIYFDEYRSLFFPLITTPNINDQTIDELIALNDMVSKLGADDDIKAIAVSGLAEKYFYAGAVNRGLKAVRTIFPETSEIDISFDKHISEFELFNQICEQAKEISRELYQFLFSIYVKWEAVKESVDNGRKSGINCLFVEENNINLPKRGVMKRLCGTIELFKKEIENDEIAFDKISVNPDDPFAGVTYKAIQAVRKIYGLRRFDDRGQRFYHAHFSIENNSERFTGDSIGLGAAIYAYVELLKTEVSRQDKFISSEVAFTGSIDDSGSILPINKNTLASKIERAFFSPVKYLVIPIAHKIDTERILDKLSTDYPRRRLNIICAGHISELIDNHNIIRSEKVCYGEYFVKQGKNLLHNKAIQSAAIVVLALLTYAIICQVHPKAWLWFSYKIDHIEVMGNRFKTINPDGHTLWVSEEFEGELDTSSFKEDQFGKRYLTYDIDADDRDELYLIRSIKGKELISNLLLFYDNGQLIDSTPVFLRTTFPGDERNAFYQIQGLYLIKDQNGRVNILTCSDCSSPMRYQFILFDDHLNHIAGPYLHTGGFHQQTCQFYDVNKDGQDELVIGGINNILNRAVVLILNPEKLDGASPPYDTRHFVQSKMSKGTQLKYISFPETIISAGVSVRNWVDMIRYDSNTKRWEVVVGEGLNLQLKHCPRIFYYLDSNFIPISCFFGDADKPSFEWAVDYLNLTMDLSDSELMDELLSDVVVYDADSIIHSPENNIYFYPNN